MDNPFWARKVGAHSDSQVCPQAVPFLCCARVQPVHGMATCPQGSYPQISTPTCAKGLSRVIHRSQGQGLARRKSPKMLIYCGPESLRMWISVTVAGTMAAVFASAVLKSGDIRVSGTLAAVRRASAR